MQTREESKKPRILVAKVGLDGHDRGAKVVVRALMDAGMEVVYTGIRQTPEMIVKTAVQEDVDAIGLSILSGAHLPLCTEISRLLTEAGLKDVLLVVGGIIPGADIPDLNKLGFKAVFGPGTPLPEITKFFRANVRTAH
ncbi:MAG: cobalamin B12-binding domain-containing protein [Chloroflexi bacterium]|nr:cobalamin B12-binding domain-containing protein [Chloroflexota bacterium]